MDQIVYVIDTETTGMGKPILPVELALIRIHGSPTQGLTAVCEVHTLFNPGKKIECGAMATHHITDEDVYNERKWADFTMPPKIDYVIGHNIDYDWEAVDGNPYTRRICTLALARYLYEDADSHKLAAMLYHIEGAVAKLQVQRSHGAKTDAINTLHLLQLMYLGPLKDGPATWEELWLLSEKARLPRRMQFGKHGPQEGRPGLLLSDLDRVDPGYKQWLLRQKDMDPYLIKALRALPSR